MSSDGSIECVQERPSDARALLAQRPLLWVIAIASVVFAMYWPTVASLRAAWEDTDSLSYTHGYLIVGIFAFLLFRERHVLRACPRHSSWPAAVAAASLGFVWLIGYRAGIEIAHQLLLPLIAWLAVYAALGRFVARTTSFAFGYLYFAVPIWSFGNEALQYLTVYAVRVMLAIARMSAYVVDNFVHIPAGTFEIAGGCSGLHFFIVGVAIAALYGELGRDSPAVKLWIVALGAVLSIVSNWVRVFWIIAAGYVTDMQHPLIRDGHYYFGWKVFAGTLVVFFLIARRIPAGNSTPVAANASPQQRVSLAAIATALCAAGVAPALAAVDWTPAASAVPNSLPERVGDWQGSPEREPKWEPHFVGADAVEKKSYSQTTASRQVSAFIATYQSQRQGKELVGFANSLAGPTLQSQEPSRGVEVQGQPFNENLWMDDKGSGFVIRHYYQVGPSTTTSDLAEQLLYAARSITGAPLSRIVAMRASCETTCDDARAQLDDFTARLVPELRRLTQTKEPAL